jgi:hypothetical protein
MDAEALKDVGLKVHAECAAVASRAVDRAGATLLHAGAVQLSRQAEVFQHACDRQLRFDVCEIDEGVVAGFDIAW